MRKYFDVYTLGYESPEYGKLRYVTSIKNYISYVINDKWQDVSTISIEIPYNNYTASLLKVYYGPGKRTATYEPEFQVIFVKDTKTSEAYRKAFQITSLDISTKEGKITVGGQSLDRYVYKTLRANLRLAVAAKTKVTNQTSTTRLAYAQAISFCSPEDAPLGAVPFYDTSPYLPASLYSALQARTGNIAAGTIFKDAESDYDAFCKAVDYDTNNAYPATAENFFRPLSSKYSFELVFTEETIPTPTGFTHAMFYIAEERDLRNRVFLSLENKSLTEINFKSDATDVKTACIVPRSASSIKRYRLISSDNDVPVTDIKTIGFDISAIKPSWIYGYQSSDYPDYYKDWYNSIHPEPKGKAYNNTTRLAPYTTSAYKTLEVTANDYGGFYTPGDSYNIGDLVTIILPDESTVPALCTAMNVTEDASGFTYHPEFTLYVDNIVESGSGS